ncbi:flagellar hook-associated protein FlgK [Aquabacterium sp. J223]|uniref:flagellar hook-associated protein FlgK n=1 Tax=Aquabacterium sp. J223 TaxID=2898431 RepID=UPI0021ADEE77|nr:flagellar hook-associated protein FlgK [Aquabacterium sp. J223]UUX97561.1 flagellar hook-associated protein FlgK [Aquabacterium sp. J223]
MGTGALMNLGIRAMFAAQASLETTGHNISNANVDGYSRQTAVLTTSQGQFTGAGFFGKGVEVTTVTRDYDEFLTREAATTKAMAAFDSAREAQLRRLETVFPTGEAGIGFAVNRFLNSMSDLASKPQDSSSRQVVLSEARNVAGRFAAASAQLDSFQQGIGSDLGVAVTAVNGLAKQIADVNDQIARVQGQGQPPNDLLDQRDRLISEISQYVQVTTQPVADGTVSVFIGGGQPLVLGSRHEQLELVPDRFDGAQSRVSMKGTGAILHTEALGGGSIAGLLTVQDTDLRDARNLLGQLAASVAGAVNDQQSYGLDLQGNAGAPVFAVGAARVLPEKGNSAASNANVTMTVADWRQLQASDYRLEVNPNTTGASDAYRVVRLTDGEVFTLSDSGVANTSDGLVDGMQVGIAGGGFGAGEAFVLQPVARAGSGMSAQITDPRQIAAASALVATGAGGNSGSAVVGSLQVLTTASAPLQGASVVFTDNLGNWELRDSGANVLGSGQWTAGNPVIESNGIRLTLSGTPKQNDSFGLAANTAFAGDNGNALGLLALRDQRLVDGVTFTDAYAAALADVGVRVRSADAAVQTSGQLAASAEEAVKSRTGVNVDEEAAKLMRFQQSYQAAAKILQVAQSVFETLLETART